MRKTIIAGNWKLNKTIQESVDTVKKLISELNGAQLPEVVICPVYTSLAAVAEALKKSTLHLGAQDLYWEESGAFTGEVSATLIKDAGCQYVIIGHSERRQFFGETETSVNAKIKAALKAGLTPIVCCGETLKERENGQMNEVLNRHIQGALRSLSYEEVLQCVIAYEPVWAIGTGKVATPDQAQEAHAYIRQIITQLYSEEVSNQITIQYGGSVKPDNIVELIGQPDVDGALIGGASLEAETFARIIKSSAEVKVS